MIIISGEVLCEPSGFPDMGGFGGTIAGEAGAGWVSNACRGSAVIACGIVSMVMPDVDVEKCGATGDCEAVETGTVNGPGVAASC